MSRKKIKDTKGESGSTPIDLSFSGTSIPITARNPALRGVIKKTSAIASTSTSTNTVKSTTTPVHMPTPIHTASTHTGQPVSPPVGNILNDNLKKAIQRINDAGLKQDKRTLDLVIQNLGYANRLISLFTKLKELSITLSDDEFNLLESNVKISGQLGNLLDVLQSVGINPQELGFSQLIKGAHASGQVQMGVEQLHDVGRVTKAPLNLMLQFPAYATEVADLKLNLRQHGYSMKPIENKLSCFDENNFSNAVKILILAIEANAYSNEIVDALLNSQEKLETVYSGALKLADERLLTQYYFSNIQEHPESANRTAKMMILLKKSRVMSGFNNADIEALNGLNRTALFFMEQLENHGMLNSENYALLRDDKVILSNPCIINEVEGVRLYEQLTEDELDSILNIFKNVTPDPKHISMCISDLQDILNNHIFSRSPGAGGA